MKNIPDSHLDLLSDEKKAFAFLGTLKADGTPQVTPVWFNTSGDAILVNSARGRLKDKNMRARPDVTLCISDPDDPYRYLQVSGKVVAITEKGAAEHIDTLAEKYTSAKYKNHQPGVSRVIYTIEPVKVDPHG
jgi:PPOX class probable F420-dependent enzyme